MIVNFFAHQPALNYGFYKKTQDWQQDPDDPGPKATLAEMENVMRFWIGMGCDGFRVDMAEMCIRDSRSLRNVNVPHAEVLPRWGRRSR